MQSQLNNADIPTPKPGDNWLGITDSQRIDLLSCVISGHKIFSFPTIIVVSAKESGEIIIRLSKEMPAHQRGAYLLDLEDYLKETIDPGLNIWLEPLGDKNSLRNLRGIEVRS